MTAIDVFLAVLALLLLVVPLIGIFDAAATPDSVWKAADQNKVVWILLQVFLGLLGTVAFYIVVEPKLNQAAPTGSSRSKRHVFSILLRVVTAVALIGVAVVHLLIVDNYEGLGTRPLSLPDQFYAQSAVAILLAIALLVRPHLLVWLAIVGFAVGSLGVLLYSRYNCLPIPGFDGCFQETWAAEGAKPAAFFEGASLVLGAIGAFLAYKARSRRSGNA